MKKDAEVMLYMRERHKGTTQQVAAARAGMSERTARRYERAGKLPSQLKRPRIWRTRENPFEEDWLWVVEQLQRDPALQGATLFALLCARHPSKYRPTQVRTLQRHIATWKATQGPDKEVYFEQVHTPGEGAQSDFTHMEEFNVTIAGEAFPHLLYHCVLTYSNVEAISICFAETFEALAEGLERALWQFGGVPAQHRTDHLSAAVRRLDKAGREDWTQRYEALMQHYAMTPTTNNAGVAHENGDVEQSHYRFQQALDQALRVRGSRDFPDRASYERFLQDLARYRNQTRAGRYAQEQQALRPLPAQPLAPCREVRVSVSRFSTIVVQGNMYSVPSRLIGATLLIRVRAEHLEGYLGSKHVVTLPRLHGRAQHVINYRHIIWSLVRKPGAFAAYRYRDDLYPTLAFRRAYDRLRSDLPARADREYVRVLHLAATLSEAEVETALLLLEEAKTVPTAEAVRDLVRPIEVRQVTTVPVNLQPYDQLLPSQRCAHA
ncbi:IS21 family transposase [Ktedonobacter racemifer]|uniref:Integrase catalytic region n=1 Tax=Ktedonobacter racemifer DSM 44963 TaxID=485913 RepID=D6TCK6_KTERA|nr:IS21 family transposase [Ktedonobacter racemifer]EFH84457.1 Integrase catalytic region [Ktedonobacter racemifer DSM 44963]EFH88877.1 Integrase catalytic region [Ktedonobacter racemifer DSM 44963]EFH90023.1 Integrase catalytic region [Ktedonobacter racemifer DSM 44963]